MTCCCCIDQTKLPSRSGTEFPFQVHLAVSPGLPCRHSHQPSRASICLNSPYSPPRKNFFSSTKTEKQDNKYCTGSLLDLKVNKTLYSKVASTRLPFRLVCISKKNDTVSDSMELGRCRHFVVHARSSGVLASSSLATPPTEFSVFV